MTTKMISQNIYISLLAILITGSICAQNAKVKKANEKYDRYSYIDARKIYLKVVEDGYESEQVFKKLGDTYYYNSEYQKAAEWYGKLMKKYPNSMEPHYYYRIAQTLKSVGKYEESKKLMDLYINASTNTVIAEDYRKNSTSLDSIIDFESKKYEVQNITNELSSSDFGPSFYGDKIVYASSSSKTKGDKTHDWTGLPYLDLYMAEINKDGKLSNAVPLKGEINSPYHESSTAFTKDRNTIYFTRNNYINGKKKRGKDKLVSLKIYKATKMDDGSWGNVKELPFSNDSYSVAHPALSPDEKRLYFSSNMVGTKGKSDLWYVDVLGNDSYGKPINLGIQINTEERETFPYISEKNNLYFSSDGHVGLGGLDIFVVSLNEKDNNKRVINLKRPINTNQDDFGFIIDEEKKMGYLSSNRNGNSGSISDEIYKVQESCNIIIRGVVSDKNTGELLPGSIVILLDDNNSVVSQTVVGSNGTYNFDGLASCGNRYSVRGTYNEKEYSPDEKIITTPLGSNILNTDLALVPPDCPLNDLGCRLDLQPIYFDFDKHYIRTNAEIELAKILQAMKEYPQLVIHIESHTDSRGSDVYNEILSEKRAQSTLEWLVGKGINRKRLSAKGYGESQLRNNCSNGVNCSEDEHQINRRSMFIIKVI